MEQSMSALHAGQSARVEQVAGPLAQRLADMGLVAGSRVDCLFSSPLGDPCAYRICGATIALRETDARQVRVTPL